MLGLHQPRAPAAGTRLLLESAVRHGRHRFVFIYSTAVYGIPDPHPIREDEALLGIGTCGQAKIDAEALFTQARERDLCMPVLRPKSVVGPERLDAFRLLYDWAPAGRNIPVLGQGNDLYPLLDVEDLCEAIWQCLTLDADCVDATFNIGAAAFGTARRQRAAEAVGHHQRRLQAHRDEQEVIVRAQSLVVGQGAQRQLPLVAVDAAQVHLQRPDIGLGARARRSRKAALFRHELYSAKSSSRRGGWRVEPAQGPIPRGDMS